MIKAILPQNCTVSKIGQVFLYLKLCIYEKNLQDKA